MNKKEKLLGKTHPSVVDTVLNIANVYYFTKGYVKAGKLYERALEKCKAQLGKDHEYTNDCACNFKHCLKASGNDEKKLEELKKAYPWLNDEA